MRCLRHAKPFVIHHWHGYGFLPGYHQPPNNSLPVYASKGSIQGTPDFTPRYWDGGAGTISARRGSSTATGMAAASALLDLYAYWAMWNCG